MNKFSIEEIKNIIINSVYHAIHKKNYILITQSWGNDLEKCACPLGCVLVKNNILLRTDTPVLASTPNYNKTEIMNILGVSLEWIDSFTSGFDNFGKIFTNKEAYELGAELRRILNPRYYSQIYKK
jgi:hypothetical protein